MALWRTATVNATRVMEEEQVDAEDPGAIKGSVCLSIQSFSAGSPCLSSSGPTILRIVS